jgi:hypothetical protein
MTRKCKNDSVLLSKLPAGYNKDAVVIHDGAYQGFGTGAGGMVYLSSMAFWKAVIRSIGIPRPFVT